MAPKRQLLSTEQSDSSSSTFSSSDDEEEQHAPVTTERNPSTSNPNQTPNPKISNDSSDDEESEEEEDEEPEKPHQKPVESETDSSSESEELSDKNVPLSSVVKPISSKPMDDKTPMQSKNTRARTKSGTVPNSRNKKPTNDGSNGDEEKKTGEDTKKQLFQRIWSDEDVVEVLQGFIEYAKKGLDPMSDMSGFHEFIKKSLDCEVTKHQVTDKIRRLKMKYKNLVKKNKNRAPSFTNPNDQKVYELSKKIWDDKLNAEDNDNDGKKSVPPKLEKVKNSLVPPAKRRKMEDISVEANGDDTLNGVLYSGMAEFLSHYGNISLPGTCERVIKEGWKLVESSKTEEVEEKWKKLQLMEIEIYMKKAELVREQTKLVLEALKSSKS